MLNTSLAFRLISTDMDRSLARTAESPMVEREAAYYLENIGSVRSVDDLMANDRLYRFATKAFGLEDMSYAKAFIRKVLEEGVDDRSSLANKLTDGRYREFAEAFNFARYGTATTSFGRTQQGTVDRYVRLTLEEDAGRQNEGVRLALYFERKAASIDSPMDILADPALLRVVQTATGLSPLTAAADIDKQAELISARVDVEDLKDPDKLSKFLSRFTSLWELENRPATATVPTIVAGQPIMIGFSADLLASLQNLKLGGI
jgi:Protein of unknown function (DUF1217)